MARAAALAVCYFQTAGDKPCLWHKHEVSFDKASSYFTRQERRTASYQDPSLFVATCQRGKACPLVPCPVRAVAGVTFPSLIRPYITLSNCQRQGGQGVCVQEVAFQSPSDGDMWKGNAARFPAPAGRQEQVAAEGWGLLLSERK